MGPAALMLNKYGYKTTILFGLGLFALGWFGYLPSARLASLPLFMVCVCMTTFACAFLEASANAWAKILGDVMRPGWGTITLNLNQGVGCLGAVVATQAGKFFILDDEAEGRKKEL